MLTFVTWFTFSDTFEPCRRWKIHVSVPELDVVPGDYLLEVRPGKSGPWRPGVADEYWDGHRFQVRRYKNKKWRVICDVEDWQAAKLFGGEVPPWPLEGETLLRIREALMDIMEAGHAAFANVVGVLPKMLEHMMDQVPADPPHSVDEPKDPVTMLARAVGAYSHFVAEADVEGSPIREGDVVVLRYGGIAKVTDPVPGAQVIPVPRESYPVVWEAAPGVFRHAGGRKDTKKLARTLKQSYAKGSNPETAPLLILRRFRRTVSAPVRATCDDGALFELLAQVGGRMPQEADDAS